MSYAQKGDARDAQHRTGADDPTAWDDGNRQDGYVQAVRDFYAYLDNNKVELRKALPDNVDVEMFIRVAKTAVQENPDLLNPAWRKSLLLSLQKAARQGLLPDKKEGVLVIRYDKAAGGKQVVWQPMVWGIKKLGNLTGAIKKITASIVYEGEPFRIIGGDDERIEHEPTPECVDKGLAHARAVYCIITGADGTKTRRWMTWNRVLEVKKVSKATSGPWTGPFADEMAIKTVILFAAKWIDLDPNNASVQRFRDALETDMEADFDAANGEPVARVAHVGNVAMLPQPAKRLDILEQQLAEMQAKSGAEPVAVPVNDTAPAAPLGRNGNAPIPPKAARPVPAASAPQDGPLGDDPPPVEGGASPPAPPQAEATPAVPDDAPAASAPLRIDMPMVGTRPHLGRYIALVRTALRDLPGDLRDDWIAANAPVYGELPDGTRGKVTEALADHARRQADDETPPAPQAAEAEPPKAAPVENAEDRAWTNAMVATIARHPDPRRWRGKADLFARYTALSPDMAAEIDAAEDARLRDLFAEGAA